MICRLTAAAPRQARYLNGNPKSVNSWQKAWPKALQKSEDTDVQAPQTNERALEKENVGDPPFAEQNARYILNSARPPTDFCRMLSSSVILTSGAPGRLNIICNFNFFKKQTYKHIPLVHQSSSFLWLLLHSLFGLREKRVFALP